MQRYVQKMGEQRHLSRAQDCLRQPSHPATLAVFRLRRPEREKVGVHACQALALCSESWDDMVGACGAKDSGVSLC